MKKLVLTLAAAAALAVAATVAYAAIPAANGVISGCKDNKGTLKLIDAEAGQACGGNQQLVQWNQQGPAGPQGPAGLQGPAGPASPVNMIGVRADGTAGYVDSPQRNVLSIARVSTGLYRVVFSSSVVFCGRWISSSESPRIFGAGQLNDGVTMQVRSYDASGSPLDTGFTLYLSC